MSYPEDTWNGVRADYEVEGLSKPKLSKKWSISRTAIDNKMKKDAESGDPWEKGRYKDEVKERIAETTKEKFVRLGLTEDEVLEYVMKGMKEPTILKWEGKGENAICTPMEDWKTRKDYIQEYFKLIGAYAAEKKQIQGDENAPLLVQQITRKIIK